MTYPELLAALGYPEQNAEAEQIYLDAQRTGELFRKPDLTRLSTLFFELADELAAAAEEIEGSEVWLSYMNLLRLSLLALPDGKIPLLPPKEGERARNLAPILALASLTEGAEREMTARGIGKEMQASVMRAYYRMVCAHREQFGFLALRPLHFFWSRHYLRPDIYKLGSLEFEITRMPAGDGLFVSQKTGEQVALRHARLEAGAYCGTVPLRGGEEGEPRTLPEGEYTPVAFSGDEILSVHIPEGARVDPATCRRSFAEALAFFKDHYPERQIRAFFCRSWLMDPELADVLPEGANILAFQRLFLRYPTPANGREVFTFVHPQPFSSYEELPENTTLMRGLKRRYLEGRPIYLYAGLIPLGDEE